MHHDTVQIWECLRAAIISSTGTLLQVDPTCQLLSTGTVQHSLPCPDCPVEHVPSQIVPFLPGILHNRSHTLTLDSFQSCLSENLSKSFYIISLGLTYTATEACPQSLPQAHHSQGW